MKTRFNNFYVKELINTFGANPNRHLDNGLVNYLAWLDQKGANKPGQNMTINNKQVLFGSIFNQIENGGHNLLSPEGKPVRALILFADNEGVVYEGKKYTRCYLFCPQLGLGDVTVILKKGTEDIIIEHGISFSEGQSMVDLFKAIWLGTEKKEMA